MLPAPAPPEVLRAMGGLYEARAPLHRPETHGELARLFASARARGVRLTLVGSQRSFGEHCLPPDGAEAVLTTALDGPLRRLEGDADGSLWVRVPASLTFAELWRRVPGYLPVHPPTGERISLAGALVACSHDAVGFLADDVRAFSLLTADGTLHECTPTAGGVAGELFRAVPGSFGALGAILEVELRLRRVLDDQRVQIAVLEKCPTEGYRAVHRLEELYRRGEYPLGRGLFFFGRRGASVLLGDTIVSPVARAGRPEATRSLLLTDERHVRNIAAQGLANRFPGLAHRLQPWAFERGRTFRATHYGFAFFQRSYDGAFEYLSRPELLPRALRGVGVDPRLTVCHQTFVVPAARRTDFLDLYFDAFDRYPALESRLELQDMIRMPECRWPLHAAHGMPGGAYLFTASFSVRRGQPTEALARAFLTEVSALAAARLGARVLLLKQVHCDPEGLRKMHQPAIELLQTLRRRVDERGTLTSRLLEHLGV